jgi:hypothetical protein
MARRLRAIQAVEVVVVADAPGVRVVRSVALAKNDVMSTWTSQENGGAQPATCEISRHATAADDRLSHTSHKRTCEGLLQYVDSENDHYCRAGPSFGSIGGAVTG